MCIQTASIKFNSSFASVCKQSALDLVIPKISLTSPIIINVPTRTSLAVETKGLLFLWLAHLNNKSNVYKQISSLLVFGPNVGWDVGFSNPHLSTYHSRAFLGCFSLTVYLIATCLP